MIAYGCMYVDVLSSIDSEQFVGNQEEYFGEQDQQELYFDQGKYNMGSLLLPIHLNVIIIILHVSSLFPLRMILAFVPCTLTPCVICIG
jgi:hypothetical protein